MIVSVPKETAAGETRVALTPDVVKRLVGAGTTVRIEGGAGLAAGFPDDAYAELGAEIVTGADAAWKDADVVVKVQPPTSEETAKLKQRSVLIGLLQPFTNQELVTDLASRGVTSFGLEALPRITRAQSMDVLSSMSTVAGYKAVLLGAGASGKLFPMLTTAAGTVVPARVLVLGAGVAGLQAIATARRLGAVVKAFDVRPEVKEQVESLGADFIVADEAAVEASGEGGYAKELTEDQHHKELELIGRNLGDIDVVITTALIPGKPAPQLITDAMLQQMKPGAVVVDLAAEAGGNCAGAKAGEEVEVHGVKILGLLNLPASVPLDASRMYARNMMTFLNHITKDGELNLDLEDEITGGTCITHEGKIVHEAVSKALNEGSGS
ncbi:MAG: Re/Si-specific NAD(P)(+) transhydrogenase subunit alpha [Gemmatimonadota bacterium]|nr:MAG: Re/Si-specific NAD(P)(+) transhydrogenase subunit alpha [Gemmatimonadota bacterium]